MLIQMPDMLPPYTSSPAPIYSASPGPDEHILQRTHPPGHSRHTGTFTQKKHGITVVIDGQKENIVCPSFGKNGLLSGTLFIDSRENVTAVSIKLVGVMKCTLSRGHLSSKVLDKTCLLYLKDGPHKQCPSAIPFATRFPSTFKNNGIRYSLPSSCNVTLPGGCFLRCAYSLTLSVVSRLHRSAPFTAEKSFPIELEYRHRTRPSRPRIAEPSLFSTIKMCPEEWLQLRIALTAESDSRPSDIHCDLFIPSLGVFGITETIPFHLQLSGSTQRLRNLFSPTSNLVPRTPDSLVRVSLLRQVGMEAIVEKTTTILEKTNTVLENCSLRPLPPGIFGLHSSTSDDTLTWEGEIQLQNISTQSFDVGTIKVVYLIAVEFTPPKTSDIKRVYHACPIKVTTDTWAGGAELGTE
ncbi:hypothetical protein C8R45DRAFT_979874 [Mycena sanguinolenta]|nr:hypothetical protein C8R45DRAFT_979874 [Mycena sanguinolenta]